MGVDSEDIVAVLVRYARAVDTKDWPRLATCFTDDVTADYGEIGSWHGVADLVRFMEEAHAGMGPTQHQLSTFQVDVAGEWASSVAYVHAVTVLASHPDHWIDTVGMYEDRLRRGSDGWRISDRTFRTTRTVVSPSLAPLSRPSAHPEASP